MDKQSLELRWTDDSEVLNIRVNGETVYSDNVDDVGHEALDYIASVAVCIARKLGIPVIVTDDEELDSGADD